MLINEAFDAMLKELSIKAQDLCDRSGVSKSRVSQFRNGTGCDIGVRSLDALLDAAQSVNPRAKQVFAMYYGETSTSINDMSMAEKGELMIALGKSIHSSINTDSESLKTA
jgi:DNA-binding Xre family transcriptional regulator